MEPEPTSVLSLAAFSRKQKVAPGTHHVGCIFTPPARRARLCFLQYLDRDQRRYDKACVHFQSERHQVREHLQRVTWAGKNAGTKVALRVLSFEREFQADPRLTNFNGRLSWRD